MQVKAMWPRMQLAAYEAGNELGSMFSFNVKEWWPMLEDIFNSPAICSMERTLVQQLVDHTEFAYLSIDCTLRCCMTVMGQSSYRAPATVRAMDAFTDQDALRSVMTARGRTSAVIAMAAIPTDNSANIVAALKDICPRLGLVQVQYVAVDNPSALYYRSLQTITPNLKIMMLDPVHVAIVYEYSAWRILDDLSNHTSNSTVIKTHTHTKNSRAARYTIKRHGSNASKAREQQAPDCYA
jgi:hypothetical protein